MAKTTFLFKKDFITEDDKELFSLEELGSLIVAWADYVNEGKLPSFKDRALRLKFNAWKEFYIDSEAEYLKKVERMEKARQSNPNNNQTEIRQNTNSNLSNNSSNANANANANERKEIYKEKQPGAKAPASVFHRPTLQEVKEYCEQRQNGIVAEQWYDYYEANGWKVGRNPMKDWKACVRSWEQRRKEEQANRPKTMKEEMHELYLKALEEDAREEAERDKGGNSGNSNPPFELLPF